MQWKYRYRHSVSTSTKKKVSYRASTGKSGIGASLVAIVLYVHLCQIAEIKQEFKFSFEFQLLDT